MMLNFEATTLNDFEGYPKKIYGDRYVAMLRLAHEGEASPILGKGGKPQTFDSEGEAYKEITKSLLRFLRGNLVRDADVAGHQLAGAHAAFNVEKQPVRTRVITVSYKRGKVHAPKS
jgi:hypothetical protein